MAGEPEGAAAVVFTPEVIEQAFCFPDLIQGIFESFVYLAPLP